MEFTSSHTPSHDRFSAPPCIDVVGVGIHATSYADTCDRMAYWAHARQSGFIVAANVHVVMTAYWDRRYREVLRSAALITPDGMPLVWALRLLGQRQQARVYGPDLMLAWCDRAVREGLSIYLFGGESEMLPGLAARLGARFPGLAIAGYHAPPRIPLDAPIEPADLARIRDSGAAVVFVALGCPKQEFWMHRAAPHLDRVLVGVGAAFNFHSGRVAQAPRWMMAMGLEWLFRLWQEPRRLWSRYLVNNPAFVVLFGCQLVRQLRATLRARLHGQPKTRL